jgi:U5 snRNP spliceosome subunit
MNTRHIVLALALAATLAAVFWPQEEEAPELAMVEPVRRAGPAAVPERQAAPKPEAATARADHELAAPRFEPEMAADLFPSQTWVPPPPPPARLPPPPPEPPPLPFKYLGRWAEADSEVVFLTHGNGVLRIHGGEVLPGGWRVDEIARTRVVFTYQPLNMQRTLGIAP